jgi:hypothetical protein
MLRKRSADRIVRFLPPSIRATQHFPIQLWLIRLTVHRKRRIFKMGGKQIARVRFFHGPPPRNCQMSRLHGLHTYTERDPYPLAIYPVCGCGSDLFLYPTTGTDALHACHIHLLPVCVCARSCFFFLSSDLSHTGGTYHPRQHHTRRTVAKRCVEENISTKKSWEFQKGERDDTENQRVNDEVCIRKKAAAAAAHCNRDPNEEGRLPILRPFSYVETASPDQNLLRH